MDEYPGQTPAPVTPPPPSYNPPAPQPGSQPQPPYQPQPGRQPQQPPRKKKTWLWIVLALVMVGLLGCCAAAAFGGLALFNWAAEPSDSIDAINQAAVDGDVAAFEKYFDADAVTRSAYEVFLEYVKGSEDYQAVVAELGEEEAERILREDVLPEDQFVAEMSAQFSLDELEEGDVPFPEYSVRSTNITDDEAELEIVTIEEGEEVTYVLGFSNESYDGETVWRLKEIKNIAELLEAEGSLE